MLASNKPELVSIGVSCAEDADVAVQEAMECIDIGATCFVLAFVPSCFAPRRIADALDRHLSTTPVFGCTTAGQITPSGYEASTLLLIAFPKAHFRCSSLLIDPLKPVSIADVSASAARLSAQFQKTAGWNRLALIFADGLSKQEDMLVAAIEAGLGEVPAFGGSAGNGLNFNETFVLHSGKFRSDAAVLILLETDLGFTGLGFDHFMPTEKQMVVTAAIPEERIVREINGARAAEEYARLVGSSVSELSPRVFAENPVLVRNGKSYNVRAIQEVAEDGSLFFLSAIDDGLVLTLGRGKEIIRTLEAGLDITDETGARPDFILGFDCFLRRLEIEQKNMGEEVSAVLRDRRVVGFNTYGEQHCGVHVNQTFVGVAFFASGRRDPF